MRQRSKSSFVERDATPEYKDVSTSEDSDWLLEDKLKLILQMKDLLTSKDNLPFDERLEKINWEKIAVGSYSSSEVKNMFYSILENTRKYRILIEILKDAEKDLLSALHIKKPITSFALFIHENKDEINVNNSKVNGIYTKTAANMYKALPDEEREQYVFKSHKAKHAYDESIFQLYHKNASIKKENNSSNQENNSKKSPFLYFLEEMKRNDSTGNYHKIHKIYYEKKPEEKLIWILKFLGTTHGKMLNLEQFLKAITYLSKDEMSIINDYEKRPKKISGFNIFMKEYFKASANVTSDQANIFKSAVENWKKLSETEKLKFKEYSAILKQQYEKDLIAFLESLPEDRRIWELNRNKKGVARNIVAEENAEVKNKKKGSRKLKINEKPEDTIMSENDTLSRPKLSLDQNMLVEENTEVKNKKKASRKLKISEKQEDAIMSENDTILPQPKKKRKLSQDQNILVEENTEVKNKKKGSRKLKTSEKPEDTIMSKPKQEIRKFLQDQNSVKNYLVEEDISDNNCIEDINDKKFDFKLMKPPSSLYKYFVLQVFEGPKKKAKSAFKSMNKSRRKKLTEQYEKSKTKYLKEFEAYLVSLPAEEIELFAKQINRSESDDISDLTDSD